MADRIITVAEPHEDHFKRMGCKNVRLVRNCKRLVSMEYTMPENDIFTILYIGGLNATRFLLEAVDVCMNLEGVRLKIGGYGALGNEIKTLAAENSNIEFMGIVPMSDVLARTVEADVIHCMFNPGNRNNQVGPPNKIFEAMVAGRPVIATREIYSGNLVEKLDMGLAVSFDRESFRQAVIRLRDDQGLRDRLGRNALKAAIDGFNWAAQEKVLIEIYESLRKSGGR